MYRRGRCKTVSLFGKANLADTAAPAPPEVGLAGEPHLVFQPAVDMATGRLLGFEALLRWTNGSGGSIPPDVVIPWAETRGRMTALNAWVLSDACAQAARWPSDLQLAVNCSVFQLRRGEAAIAAASALERSGLNPDRLTVEVTEASLTDSQATADLHTMHQLGIQLALDDVGPDCSILGLLRERAVNTLKIDAVLIAGLAIAEGASKGIVEGIVELSQSLGICTVAEAVETADQVAVLRELCVDVAQGYFFSPPLSAEDAYVLAAMEPLPTFPLTGPVGAVPVQAAVPGLPRLLVPPVGVVPVRAPVPVQAPVPGLPRPVAPPVGAVPVQAPVPAAVPVQARPLARPVGAVPVQARPLPQEHGRFPGAEAEKHGVLATRDVQIDQLNLGIAKLVSAVERLNELLEPLLQGPGLDLGPAAGWRSRSTRAS